MGLKDYIITENTSVIDAMRVIDKGGNGIVFICDEENRLCGVLSDGVVRRYIINNGDLSGPIADIYKKDFLSFHVSEKSKAEAAIKNKGIRGIPLVDDSKRIKEIIFEDELCARDYSALNIPVVIMAGGKGTRLYPYTQILPKPLMPIGDKTITEHILARFSKHGCSRAYMIVNHMKNFIESYFSEIKTDIPMEFVHEEEFRGTGGGLSLVKNKVDSTFFLSNCDIIIEEDYEKILDYHVKNNNMLTMVCATKQQILPYGTVDMENGRAVRINEKPRLDFITNTGFYVIEPEFIDKIPDTGNVPITDVIQKCIDEGENVGVFPVHEEQWLDMGQLEELDRMKQRIGM